MSGVTAMTMLAAAATAGTAYSIYSGERAADRQRDAANQARSAATTQADRTLTHLTPRVIHEPDHPADVPETLANPSKARDSIGWEPTIFFPHRDPP